MAMACLLNSMELSIAKPHMLMKAAKEVRNLVREIFSDLENSSHIFELKTILWQLKQGDQEVTAYYNEIVVLW